MVHRRALTDLSAEVDAKIRVKIRSGQLERGKSRHVSGKYVAPRGASGLKVAHVLDRARKISLAIVPAAMMQERAEKLSRAGAEDEAAMQTWRDARCGCGHQWRRTPEFRRRRI